jgi:hypothetical protein
VVLVERIGQVAFAGPVTDQELLSAHSIFEPTPSHVQGFGALLLHGVIGKSFGGGVVDLDRGWWLVVTKFSKSRDDGNCVLAIQTSGCNFGFHCGSNHNIDDFAHCLNGAIEWRNIGGRLGWVE